GRAEGYQLTDTGLDYLALNVFVKRGLIAAIGRRIGVGKEAEIFIAQDPEGNEFVLKFHRLGRTSFKKSVKTNRDYMDGRTGHASWIYLSKLAALKEFAYMTALHERGIPVPTPIGYSRHCVAMSLVKGLPLNVIKPGGLIDPKDVCNQIYGLMADLASIGLIHGDFNEFNTMVVRERIGDNGEVDAPPTLTAAEQEEEEERQAEAKKLNKVAGIDLTHEEGEWGRVKMSPGDGGEYRDRVVLIDFPQIVSTDHCCAKSYYTRDTTCVRVFFRRKFNMDFPAPDFTTMLALAKASMEDGVDVGETLSAEQCDAVASAVREEVGMDNEGEAEGEGESGTEGEGVERDTNPLVTLTPEEEGDEESDDLYTE
ncbi:serine/threonine-protein kinase Rio2, partial [Kipferlia bialata]